MTNSGWHLSPSEIKQISSKAGYIAWLKANGVDVDAATQAEVDAGTADDVFVTPSTLFGWAGGSGSSGSSGSIKKIFTAGETINGGKAVMVGSDGKLYIFNTSSIANYGKWIGIADTAALTGQPCTVVVDGEMTFVGSGWTPGVIYYVSLTGSLSSTPPTSGIIKRVGLGVAIDKIILSPEIDIQIT